MTIFIAGDRVIIKSQDEYNARRGVIVSAYYDSQFDRHGENRCYVLVDGMDDDSIFPFDFGELMSERVRGTKEISGFNANPAYTIDGVLSSSTWRGFLVSQDLKPGIPIFVDSVKPLLRRKAGRREAGRAA